MNVNFEAYVTAALFDSSTRAIFALGDGTVRFEDGTTIDAHPNGSVQCACAHPSGEGIVTGGDDGRVMWSRASRGARRYVTRDAGAARHSAARDSPA